MWKTSTKILQHLLGIIACILTIIREDNDAKATRLRLAALSLDNTHSLARIAILGDAHVAATYRALRKAYNNPIYALGHCCTRQEKGHDHKQNSLYTIHTI